MTYGFLGLGQMGGSMAANLAKRFETIVFDRNPTKVTAAAASGAKPAGDLASLAVAETIFLSLPDTEVVEAILFGTDGLAQHLRAGTTVVDTSTINYDAAVAIAERLAQAGVAFVDAPVSGMPQRAQDGTLTMMCGCDRPLFDALAAPMATMATNILHVGPVGNGQLMKLVNQLLFDINAAAIAEVLPFAVKMGLDPEQVESVVNSGTGRSHASATFLPAVLQGQFTNQYPMAKAYKDLVCGVSLSARNGIPLPVLAAATATYQQALLTGHGDKDKGGMICVYEDLLGVSVRSGLPARKVT